MKKIKVTFERVANGEFHSFADGVKTPFVIVNGCHGAPGVRNMYGVTRDMNTAKWIGTLQAAKKVVIFTIQDRANKGRAL